MYVYIYIYTLYVCVYDIGKPQMGHVPQLYHQRVPTFWNQPLQNREALLCYGR